MKKVLILRSNDKDKFVRQIKSCDMQKYYKCKDKNILFRIFRKLDLDIVRIFFGSWKKQIKDYEYFILFDNYYNGIVSKYIKRKNPNSKIILWFWNPISEYSKSYLLHKNIDEVWTYDKNDAKKYNIKYNSQFYNKEIACPKLEIKQDVIFLGMNKGRKDIIGSYNNQFINNQLKTKICIIETSKEAISYNEYLKLVGESNAILDIVMDNVPGLTLRCMESLFFNKKLITNNLDIENYDFYNPNNIFILGKDNMDNIKQFINSPYEPIDEDIVKYYDFEEWLKRFELE